MAAVQSAPLGQNWGADSHRNRASTWEPLPGAQDGAGAGDAHWHQWHAGLRRHHEGTHAKGPQARRTPESSLWEKEHRTTLTDGLQHTIGVFDAALWVEAFDKLGPETPEQYARKELFSQLALGHKADRARQHCDQHQGIEIAGMVDHQHTGLVAGEMLQPTDPYREAKEPQQELR